VVVRNPRVAEEYRSQAAAGGIEQSRPVTVDLPVLQQVQANSVPVEAQAGVKVADDHHGMMNGRHRANLALARTRLTTTSHPDGKASATGEPAERGPGTVGRSQERPAPRDAADHYTSRHAARAATAGLP